MCCVFVIHPGDRTGRVLGTIILGTSHSTVIDTLLPNGWIGFLTPWMAMYL
jgi:hypothetical protein